MLKNYKLTTKGFSLIELLVVIVIIAIISIVAFINFGNKAPDARNSIRKDTYGKISTAFQASFTQEKLPLNTCLPESTEIDYIWSGGTLKTCQITLDDSPNAKAFLLKLGVSGMVKDPSPVNSNYQFSYVLGSSEHQFAYFEEAIAMNNGLINSAYADNQTMRVVGTFTKWTKWIATIILYTNNVKLADIVTAVTNTDFLQAEGVQGALVKNVQYRQVV